MSSAVHAGGGGSQAQAHSQSQSQSAPPTTLRKVDDSPPRDNITSLSFSPTYLTNLTNATESQVHERSHPLLLASSWDRELHVYAVSVSGGGAADAGGGASASASSTAVSVSHLCSQNVGSPSLAAAWLTSRCFVGTNIRGEICVIEVKEKKAVDNSAWHTGWNASGSAGAPQNTGEIRVLVPNTPRCHDGAIRCVASAGVARARHSVAQIAQRAIHERSSSSDEAKTDKDKNAIGLASTTLLDTPDEPESMVFVTGGWDCRVKVWTVVARVGAVAGATPYELQELHSLDLGGNAKVFALDLCWSSTYCAYRLAVGASDKRLHLYELDTQVNVCDADADVRGNSSKRETERERDSRDTSIKVRACLLEKRLSTLKFQIRSVQCLPDGEGFVHGSIEGRASWEYFGEQDAGGAAVGGGGSSSSAAAARDKQAKNEKHNARKFAFKCHRRSEKHILTLPSGSSPCRAMEEGACAGRDQDVRMGTAATDEAGAGGEIVQQVTQDVEVVCPVHNIAFHPVFSTLVRIICKNLSISW